MCEYGLYNTVENTFQKVLTPIIINHFRYLSYLLTR